MAWKMSDDKVQAALSQKCIVRSAVPELECTDPISGLPLLEACGRPVHLARLEP